MEWSGRCCRHSASHSVKWEATAGSVQQLKDFISQTRTSANRTNTRSQTYTVSADRKENKQTVQWSRSCKQPNQPNLCFLGPLQLQIPLQVHNQLSQIGYQIKASAVILWAMLTELTQAEQLFYIKKKQINKQTTTQKCKAWPSISQKEKDPR